MITVDKSTFQFVISKFETTSDYEVEGEYGYDSVVDQDGEMIGLISYHAHRGDSYTLLGPAETIVRDTLDIPRSAAVGDKIHRLDITE